MTAFFLDSSALVKRYLTEVGSAWVEGITDPVAGHRILVAEITLVEVAAALAARHRAPGGLSQRARDSAVALLRRHFTTEYEVATGTRPILERAVDPTQRHRLRGYDAVQLATALVVEAALRGTGLPGLTFVVADADLTAASRAKGLAAADPNLYRYSPRPFAHRLTPPPRFPRRGRGAAAPSSSSPPEGLPLQLRENSP